MKQSCQWTRFFCVVAFWILAAAGFLLSKRLLLDDAADLTAESYPGVRPPEQNQVVAAEQNQPLLGSVDAEPVGSQPPVSKATWLRNDPRSLKTLGQLKKSERSNKDYKNRLKKFPRSRDDEGHTAITEYFWQKSNGIVLEMGGLDGLYYSSSRAVQTLGWHRILVEGSPKWWDRALKVSSDATYIGAAICNSGSVHYLQHSEDPTTNGIVEFMSPAFLSRFYKGLLDAAEAESLINDGIVDWSHFNFADFAAVQTKIVATSVPCVTLRDVFSTLQTQHINLFVLDVEGAELAVLESIDFQRMKFDVICVETMAAKASQEAMRPKGFSDKVKALLASNGYKFDFQKSRNSWFHRKDFVPNPEK